MRGDASNSWRRYLRFWGSDAAADMEDELAFHLEERVRDLVSAGLSEAEARRRAASMMGDAEALKRECIAIDQAGEVAAARRDWLIGVRMDVRQSVRQLTQARALTFIAVMTLALGIGATMSLYSIIDSVLLQRLPFENADRIVSVTETHAGERSSVGPGQYTEWVRRNRVFETLTARTGATFNLLLRDREPQRVMGAWVTTNFFATFQLPPRHGRYFDATEGTPASNHVVVLSSELFDRQFGGDARIIGSAIELNDEAFTVIGVAPVGYRTYENDALLWVPLALSPQQTTRFNEHWLIVAGALKPGITAAAAQADVERISRELAQLEPNAMLDRSARVTDYREELAADYSRQLLILFGAVVFILLLACLNVSSLAIARVNARRREMAVRSALGASKSRIARQLVTEGVVLAALGGAAALVVAAAATRILIAIAPAGVPRIAEAGLHWRVIVFGALITALCGAVLGLLPAIGAVHASPETALRESGRAVAAGVVRDRLRSVLVAGEVAIALALVTGAGLFVRSAWNLQQQDPGFDAANLVTLRFSLPGARYDSRALLASTFDRVISEVESVPGVVDAAAVSVVPLAGPSADVAVRVEGRTLDPARLPTTQYQIATPGFFETLRIPVQRGRGITTADREGSGDVVVINEALARLLWPDGADPIGKRVSCCTSGPERWRTVVGIAGDVRHAINEDPLPAMYIPHQQAQPDTYVWFSNSLAIIARTRSVTPETFSQLTAAVRRVDPALPIYNAQTIAATREQSTASTRFSLILLGTLGAVAAALAALGIYGVISFHVQQRTQEIGIRMALGARTRTVIALVMRQGALLAFAGIACGLVLSLLSSRVLSSMLYDVKPSDPATYTAVVIMMCLIAALACFAPARRAASVDPLQSMRG